MREREMIYIHTGKLGVESNASSKIVSSTAPLAEAVEKKKKNSLVLFD
jgi:hypothetical protein